MDTIKKIWNEKPLTLILWLAVLFRLLAVFFSKGFGMHDDHFLVIEASQSWVDGYDYNNWLPGSTKDASPTGHSFFYVGFHYLFLYLLDFLGIHNPQGKMFLVRLIHAAYSLITVILGYRIALKIHNRRSARLAGLLLALYWLMPFLSVRNLVEVVCVPPMMYALWLIIKNEHKTNNLKYFFWAGFFLGLAFSIRYQTLIFTGGVGLALLLQQKWKETLFTALGTLLSIFLVQGIVDLFIWGYPFGELQAYILYNLEHAYDYNVIAWYSYILLILGLLLPPVCFFIFFGFLREWRKNLLLFLPSALFLIFHSAFPNKQERFILPIIPFIIVLGIVGWLKFYDHSTFWQKHRKLHLLSWSFFWVINLSMLLIVSTMYSKKARVESMTYLSKYDNIGFILTENTNKDDTKMIPRFYLGEWVKEHKITKQIPIEWHAGNGHLSGPGAASFVLFFEKDSLDKRVQNLREEMPGLVFEEKIEPGFVDKVMHWLNPVNANNVIYIYRNKEKIPKKKP
ncbi:MAG: glycosyltransferase family 39 protein [Bacteroidales bacterium]|nr:glycosyltransferase family 39 protein [Bacteroidales bacterium]